jgi:hypothetical protein
MSTYLIVDQFYEDDDIHVVQFITDPVAQVIEEVRLHLDVLNAVEEFHTFYPMLSPDDALECRTTLVEGLLSQYGDERHESAMVVAVTPDLG